MKEELPVDLPDRLRLKIRAGLLRIQASGKTDTKTCLDEAYHVFARVLSHGGIPLSARVLKEDIPAWVLQWAIARKWVVYPPQRVRRQMPEFIPGKYTSTHESVPEEELTVTFGEYMVTEKYKSRIMDMFEVAIAHWEAEAAEGAESPAQAIAEGVMSTESRSRASALDSWPKLELTTVGNGAQSAQPAAVQKPDSKGRKRGPRPNYETAIKVAEVVRGIAGDGGWPAKLDEICDALDEAKIPRPKTWKKRGHQDWDDALSGERSLVVKAITHHLKLNEVQRKTLG